MSKERITRARLKNDAVLFCNNIHAPPSRTRALLKDLDSGSGLYVVARAEGQGPGSRKLSPPIPFTTIVLTLEIHWCTQVATPSASVSPRHRSLRRLRRLPSLLVVELVVPLDALL